MGKIIAFQISFLVIFVPSYLYFSKPKSPVVLAEKIVVTPTPSPSPSPTPAPTETPTPEPTQTQTPKPTIKPTIAPTVPPAPKYTSQQINEFIDRFAGQYAVDPNIVRHIALCESGFNPEAVNGPYSGLFQFGSNTWQNYRIKMGENPEPNLRVDAEEAVQTASYALSLGNGKIWPNCQP